MNYILCDNYHGNTVARKSKNPFILSMTKNYAPFYQILNEMGHKICDYNEKINNKSLENCSIFIIIKPELSFSFLEKKYLINYIKRGGSLLIIIDHVTKKVMENNNDLLCQFGIKISGDRIAGVESPELIYCEEDFNSSHPIISGNYESERVKKFHTFVGTSIGFTFKILNNVKYTNILKIPSKSFIGNFIREKGKKLKITKKEYNSYKYLSQGMAIEYYLGKIFIISEAGCFSTQDHKSLQVDLNKNINNKQLLINLINWLS